VKGDPPEKGVQLATMQNLVRYWGISASRVYGEYTGGLFAGWRQPRLFTEEIRAAFRSRR
jgi:hypothetical protein